MAAWFEDTRKKSAVREYRDRKAMDRDIEESAAHGWRVVTVTDLSQRSGCLRMVTLGFFALIWKPKSKLLVTYARD